MAFKLDGVTLDTSIVEADDFAGDDETAELYDGATAVAANAVYSKYMKYAGLDASWQDSLITKYTSIGLRDNGSDCEFVAKGAIAYDGSFIYVCILTDTWLRSAIATW